MTSFMDIYKMEMNIRHAGNHKNQFFKSLYKIHNNTIFNIFKIKKNGSSARQLDELFGMRKNVVYNI